MTAPLGISQFPQRPEGLGVVGCHDLSADKL